MTNLRDTISLEAEIRHLKEKLEKIEKLYEYGIPISVKESLGVVVKIKEILESK